MLRSPVLRQGQLEGRMGSDGARGEGQPSPSNEQQDGVRTGGNLQAPGVVRVGEASRGKEFVDSSVNFNRREISSMKQVVPKFCGKPENFPVWSKYFKAFASMNGCLGSLFADIDVAVEDTTKDTHYFFSQDLTHAHIRSARVAWLCLTKSTADTDLLDRVFAKQSPSGAWKMLRDWFSPRPIATQVIWSDAFDAVKMTKEEEPMEFFSRGDNIASTLASLGVLESEGDVNRKLVRVLTDDYENEQRTLLYRDEIKRAEIDNIFRQRNLRLPVLKGKNVGQALFSSGVTRDVVVGVAVVVADPIVAMVGRGTRDRQMQELAMIAKVATTPPSLSKQSPKPSTVM